MRIPKKHKKFGLAALLCCLFALCCAACESGPRLPPLAPDAVILCFGDSLTYGAGAKPQESYPAVLAELVERKVVNAGLSGESSPYGLKRLPEALDAARPQLLVLCHGANDMLNMGPENRAQRLAGLRDNLRRMLELAKNRGIAVVLLAVPEVKLESTPGRGLEGLDYRPLAPPPLYAELAEAFGAPLEADILSGLIGDRSLKSDIIHPNAAGYRKLAEAVAEVLRQNGAIR